MGCQSEVTIGDNLTFTVTTHDPDTGVLTDADAVPSYRVYEDETGTPILTGSMAKLDGDNTTGYYSEQIACTSGNGFESGKSYNIYISATVGGDTGGLSYGFRTLARDADDLATEAKQDVIDGIVDDLKAALTVVKGTIQSENITSTTLQIANGEDTDDAYNGMTVVFEDTVLGWVARPISDYADNGVITWVLETDGLPKDGGTAYIIPVASDVMRGTDDAATANKLLAYVQLLARSDEGIATDNATELSEINADGGHGEGDFANTVDSIEALADALDAGLPRYTAASASQVDNGSGTGDYEDTAADDGSYWQIAGADKGEEDDYGMDATLTFSLGTTTKPSFVHINAYETFNAGPVLVWAYNYVTSSWDAIADSNTGISGNSERNYTYILLADYHQQTSDGEVKIRFTCVDESTNKYLFLDQVLIGGTRVSGLTAAAIARAVHEYNLDYIRHTPDEMIAGHLLKRGIALGTTVAAADTNSTFTLADGIESDDAYKDMRIEVRDESSETRAIETRRITSYTSGRVVVVSPAFTFVPAVGDSVHIHNQFDDGPSQTSMDMAHALLATSSALSAHADALDAHDTAMDTAHALLATEEKQDVIDTVVDRIEQQVGLGYPAANIFYIDPTNGSDDDDVPGTKDAPVKSWYEMFNTDDGRAYAKSPEPVLVYMLAQQDQTPIDMDASAETPLGCNIEQPNVRIVGVGYPWLTNTDDGDCTISFEDGAHNCEISGFRISHPSAQGIHCYADDVLIHDIILCGDCSKETAAGIGFQNAKRCHVWNVRSVADADKPESVTVSFIDSHYCSARDIRSNYVSHSLVYFYRSHQCRVINCHLTKAAGTQGIYYGLECTDCIALGCTEACDVISSNVFGSGNKVSSLERQTADDALTAYDPPTKAELDASETRVEVNAAYDSSSGVLQVNAFLEQAGQLRTVTDWTAKLYDYKGAEVEDLEGEAGTTNDVAYWQATLSTRLTAGVAYYVKVLCTYSGVTYHGVCLISTGLV